MKRVLRFAQIITIVALLVFCGCSGEGFGIAGFGDPCSWLPKPNQELVVDGFFDLRADGFSRLDVFGFFFSILANAPNLFDPTPEEISFCLDDLLDQVYGPQ